MNVLLSIKPKYAEKIVKGTKRYEFRRSIFKRNDIEKVYIYSSSPVSKIIASFEIEDILIDSPEQIWKSCQKYAGIAKNDFLAYFNNSDVAYAIKICEVNSFQEPLDPFNIIEDFKPPQSFYYVPSNFIQSLSDVHVTELIKPDISTEPMQGISFMRQL